MTDIVLNNGWPTTWRQRMPFDNTQREQCLVIDPWRFIAPTPQDHNSLLMANQWLNRDGPAYFYRYCTDPDNGLDRELVQNFSRINSIDYKIYGINISQHGPARLLSRILANPEPRKLLHISMDDQQCRYPEQLMDMFRSLQFRGQLAIEIVESCALRFSLDRVKSYRQCFPTANKDLLSIDYHYNFENGRSVFVDMLAEELEPYWYDSVVVKDFR